MVATVGVVLSFALPVCCAVCVLGSYLVRSEVGTAACAVFTQEDESPIFSALAGNGDAEFDPSTGNWKRAVFPTKRPSNRNEVFHLSSALNTMLQVWSGSITLHA